MVGALATDRAPSRADAQGRPRPRPLAPWLPPALAASVYLPLALCYSLMTRAWEANDELDHATYVEYIVRHGSLPLIKAANGHESHQPPLYYLLAAGWQELLRIPAFTPSATPNPRLAAVSSITNRFFELLHTYTPVQHRDAVYLHELRLLSVLLGLGTVLLAYGCARLVCSRRPTALAVALTVALWPKLLVVDSAVTNDSLVIMLCAAMVYLFLLAEQARREGRRRRRHRLLAAMGLAMGLALLTKYNSAPLVGLLLVLSAVPAGRDRAQARGTAAAVVMVVASSGWWFVRNKVLYGQFLATRVTTAYLKAWLPPLVVPVPWTNVHRFWVFVPENLFRSTWYDGGWNQYDLPKWANDPLWALAALSVAAAVLALAHRGPAAGPGRRVGGLALAGVLGPVPAAVVAVDIIAQTTTQAEGRVAFVGLVGWAVLLVMGTDFGRDRGPRLGAVVFAWPLALLAVNGYVFYQYLVPLRGL